MKSVKLGEVMDDDSPEDGSSGDESVFDNGDDDDDESWDSDITGLEQERGTAER